MNELRKISIDQIKVGEHEQRLESEDPGIAELAASIRRVGVINPLVLVRDGDDLRLVAGHRRLFGCSYGRYQFRTLLCQND